MLLTRGRACATFLRMANPNFGDFAHRPHRRGGPHKKKTKPAPAADSVRHLRCPACGTLRAITHFGDASGGAPHRLVAKIKSVGGYKAIRWDDAAVTPADRALLAAALRAALERLGE